MIFEALKNTSRVSPVSLVLALLAAGTVGGADVGAINALHTLADVAPTALTGISAASHISVVGTSKVSGQSQPGQGMNPHSGRGNGVPVKNVAQVRATVAKSNKSVALLILRASDKIFVPINLG